MAGRRGNGEGSIYKREDGVWIGAIDLGWSEGKRVRKTVNARTRAEVVRKLEECRQVAAKGVSPTPERLTVETYLQGWLQNRIPGTISPRTLALYEHAVESYINPTLGKIRLAKLTPSDVSAMLQILDSKGYSPSTQRMARATLRRALRMAEQDGLLARNVAAIAEGPKMRQREGRSLTPEQAKQFLEAVGDDRLEAAYTLTLALGLRRGEVLGLRWDDITVGEDTVILQIHRQLIRDKHGVSLTELKTAGSRRILHLSEPLIELLGRHKIRQEAEAFVKGKRWHNEHNLIFTSTIGTPLDPEQFGKTVPKFTKAAGLGHWSIHELRHSCASLLIAMEVPLEVVAEQLGHASIRVTKDVYGHLLAGSRAQAAEAMRVVLFGEKSPENPGPSNPLATKMATNQPFQTAPEGGATLLPGRMVGRPGLDPGTLGLKVPCSSR